MWSGNLNCYNSFVQKFRLLAMDATVQLFRFCFLRSVTFVVIGHYWLIDDESREMLSILRLRFRCAFAENSDPFIMQKVSVSSREAPAVINTQNLTNRHNPSTSVAVINLPLILFL